MCDDSSLEVRLNSMINLELNQHNYKALIYRIRDKEVKISEMIFQKLISEKVSLKYFKVPDIYKIIYDGINHQNKKVVSELFRYIEFNYNKLSENKIQNIEKIEGPSATKNIQEWSQKKTVAIGEIFEEIIEFLRLL